MAIRFASYLRVSTQQQGITGLGIDAQRETVRNAVAVRNATLLREFVEQESGRKTDRPELREALRFAKTHRCAIVFAKVDRLARNARFLLEIIDSGVEVLFCDLPQIDGPAGRMLLTIMASVAEFEAAIISDRTKAGLAAAKRRGVKLGKPKGYLPAAGVMKAMADERARELAPTIAEIRKAGVTSLRGIARALNARGVPTFRPGEWHAASVGYIVERLAALEAI